MPYVIQGQSAQNYEQFTMLSAVKCVACLVRINSTNMTSNICVGMKNEKEQRKESRAKQCVEKKRGEGKSRAKQGVE